MFGHVADKYGRRPCFFIMLTIEVDLKKTYFNVFGYASIPINLNFSA